MNSSLSHVGRPFGGCAILFRKYLSPCVSPLSVSSDRFCAVRINTSDSHSFLLFSVYMPCENQASSFTDYLNTLGEIQGIIDSQPYNGIFLIGDFNVDFDRSGPLANLLHDFMSDLDLVHLDLDFSRVYI